MTQALVKTFALVFKKKQILQNINSKHILGFPQHNTSLAKRKLVLWAYKDDLKIKNKDEKGVTL